MVHKGRVCFAYSSFFYMRYIFMQSDKPFKTIDEQIHILKDGRNLTINNVEAAKDILQRYGYYEIINGYKTPFLIDPNDDDKGYKETASFEHIFDLYKLDRDIRKDLLESLEYFEQTFKQALAYSVAKLISDDQSRYTATSHYNTGKTHHGRHGRGVFNDRDRLLRKFNKLINSNKQPFKHYREDHHNIPPWIMIKGMTFGEVIYWYRLSKPEIRFHVISELLGIDSTILRALNSDFKISQMIGDLLGLYLSYRNLTAHGGRVYNHRSEIYKLRWLPLIYPNAINVSRQEFNKGNYRSSLGVVMRTLKIFDNPEPFTNLEIWLQIHLKQYLKQHKEDKEFLLEAMELDNIHIKFNLD